MLRLDTLVWPVMIQIGACLTQELAHNPTGCGTMLLPGGVPAVGDYCSEGGVAWVRLVNGLASDDQITTASGKRCATDVQLTLEVGVMRCSPVGDERSGPTAEQWMETTAIQLSDMASIRRAIECCETPLTLGNYLPVGPEGDCVGGFWTALFDG